MGFLGCGAVIRREAYLAVGGFSRLLFIGGEEQLLAYDLAAAGLGRVLPRRTSSPTTTRPPSRQPATRRYQEARNRALVAWLRRPLRCALTETGRLARQAVHDPVAGRALGGLAVRLPRGPAGPRGRCRPTWRRLSAPWEPAMPDDEPGRPRTVPVPRCPTPGSRWW